MTLFPIGPYAWLLIFVCLQLADFGLTWILIGSGWCSDIVEANPLAAFLLNRHGWIGMAILKATTTLIVVGIILHIMRQRPILGRRLIQLACMIMALVVGYSSSLAGEIDASENPRLQEVQAPLPYLRRPIDRPAKAQHDKIGEKTGGARSVDLTP